MFIYINTKFNFLSAVRLLLENGADVGTKDEKGRTALREAVVRLLLDHGGVDVNSKDQHGAF
jgi:ankyrin repeat protein